MEGGATTVGHGSGLRLYLTSTKDSYLQRFILGTCYIFIASFIERSFDRETCRYSTDFFDDDHQVVVCDTSTD